MNTITYMHLPNNNILAINNIIQGIRSDGIISVPVKYKATHIGHMNRAFKKPNVVKANAICPTGGSPITLRNITLAKRKKKNYNKNLIKGIITTTITNI